MKKYLYSIHNCIVEINNAKSNSFKSHNLTAGKLLEFEADDFVKIFYDNNLTYLDLSKPNENVSVTHFPNYELYEFIPEKKFEPVFFLSKKLKNGNACVIGSPFWFNVEIGGNKYYSKKINEKTTDFAIFENANVVSLEGEQNEQDYLLLFHKHEKKFYEFCGNVEYSESFIKAVVPKNTLNRHGELLDYEITDKSVILKSKEPIYLNKMPSTVPPFLNHIAFFECVREKDFVLAKTYLEEDLKNKLTDEHFEQFFGEFDKIKPIKEQGISKIALIKDNIAKVFILNFSDNKISDIVEE